MRCKKCGVELPDDAVFCFNCGSKVASGPLSTKGDVVVRMNRKILYLSVLAAALIVAGILFAVASSNNTQDSENIESSEAKETGMYQVTLTGRYVVGEDEELPPGIYEITALPDERNIDLHIVYGKGEDDYDSYYTDRVTGYKLKTGYVVEIDDEGAVFTKTGEITENTVTTDPDQTTGADNE